MLAKRKADCSGGGGASKQLRRGGLVQRAVVSSTSSITRNKNCRVKVYVRVRPFKSAENSSSNVVQVGDEEPRTSLIFDPKITEDQFYFKGESQTMRDITKKTKKNQLFEFDQIFSVNDDNQTVFNATAKTIIGSILEGYNCSVFAYGATGAGKTYTMLGKEDSPGISYLTILELLKHIDSHQEKLKINIFVSYLEVYNEEVRDLLSPSSRKLDLREESGGSVCVSGLKVIAVNDTKQLFTLLESGNKQRTQHPTDSNAESSRSHAVFQVGVKMTEKENSKVRLAKLTMIDLAGSERGCATGFKGKQFKEGRAINQSLLALGNCINALADGQKYVPYRDSKLTRILKDSLGGNCQTIMIANISPSQNTYDETYNTLKYATRARSIITTANQNLVESHMSTAQYRQLVFDLKQKLSKTEAEHGELMSWKKEIDLAMGEKLKLYSELMALESQKKITELRLNEAILSQNLLQPSDQCQRLNSSIEVWRKRIEVLKSRIDELQSKISQNKTEVQKVEKKMHLSLNQLASESQTKELYISIHSSWKDKLNDVLNEVELNHCQTMLRLGVKKTELLTSFRDDFIPFHQSCFKILKAYGNATATMVEEHEMLLKRLQNIKYVSWGGDHKEKENEDSCPVPLTYYYHLNRPGSSEVNGDNHLESADHRNVVPAGGGLARVRHTTPLRNDKKFVSPLRTLQPTSKTIIRNGAKSPKPKVLHQIISNLNKENLMKSRVAKKLSYNTKELPNKRAVFKSSSLSNLTAV